MTIKKDPLTREERTAKCPRCGSTDKYEHGYRNWDHIDRRFKCRKCGRTYNIDSVPDKDRIDKKICAIRDYLEYNNPACLQKKSNFKITVTDIAEWADISRETFYTALRQFKTELSKIDESLTIGNICDKKTDGEIDELLNLIFLK